MLIKVTSRLPNPSRQLSLLAAIALSPLTACGQDEPPADTPAEITAPETIDLIADAKDNAHPHWERLEFGGSGEIEFRDGTLSIEAGEMLSGIRWTDEDSLPTSNYEVTLEVQKVEGYDFFCGLTFPFGDLETCATLVLGGWGGGVTGLSSVDNLDASENATTDYKRFEDGKWYAVKLRVTDELISAWLDGELLFEQETEGRKIALRPGQIDMCMPFGLATFQTDALYRNFEIARLPQE